MPERATSTEPAHVRFVYARVESRGEAELNADWEILDESERVRASRFIIDADKRAFICAHAILRRALSHAVLSHAMRIAPATWRFRNTPHGRPEVLEPSVQAPLRFNLSHTRRSVACAVTFDREIGIDIEDETRGAPLDVAERYFAPAELAALRGLETREREERFFVYWTLKEAYIKARGRGLSLPLDDFAFDLTDPSKIAIAFSPAHDCRDNPSQWWFASWQLPFEHRAAIAVRAARVGEPVTVEIVDATPPL